MKHDDIIFVADLAKAGVFFICVNIWVVVFFFLVFLDAYILAVGSGLVAVRLAYEIKKMGDALSQEDRE